MKKGISYTIKALRKAGAHQKGDGRILGESTFVEQVLSEANEEFERKYRFAAEGFSLEGVAARVAELLAMSSEEVLDSARDYQSVQARSLLCYWATRELGINQSQLAQTLHITQPAISQAGKRGAKLVKQHRYSLIGELNYRIMYVAYYFP